MRNTERLSESSLQLRKALVDAAEPADLIFNRIPAAFGFSIKGKEPIDAKKLADRLSQSLAELRRAFPELQCRMQKAVVAAFGYEDKTFEDWRQEIAKQAETVLIGVSAPDLRAFALKLANATTSIEEWLESLGSLVIRCPPSRWRDRDEDVFNEGVRNLAGQFHRVYAIYFDRSGATPELAVRVAITRRSGEERQSVLQLTTEEAQSLENTTNRLRTSLGKNKPVTLAALSKLLWELLE